ncbi:MAG: proline dehydrogenase family protein [Bacteroidetes bacterium]|nr:proline dehydrogenase family protein [Bacteroidota bacterium]
MASDPIPFDNTEVAFSYKSNSELKKANLIFSIVNNPTTSSIATSLAKASLALHLPIKGIIRATVFQHFCGGETIDQSDKTVATLHKFGVGTILDYSVEGAKNEEGFEKTAQEIMSTIEKAKNNPAIPFSVFKPTGLAAFDLLEKVHAGEKLSPEDQAAWNRVHERVDKICKKAFDNNVPVLIDAEDSWIQKPIDDLAYEMMRKYNGSRAIVYNTFQMYHKVMLSNLTHAIAEAEKGNYFFGAKLVRGAYMEKEGERAAKLGYENPIHPSKAATDEAFNKGLALCVEKRSRVSLVCGSHNEYSNQYLATLMESQNIAHSDQHMWFAQLLGMSDNISFNVAKAGYNVVKYVPYGPVEAVMPYLLRRAAENTSVAGQSSRELTLIRKELKRRKSAK